MTPPTHDEEDRDFYVEAQRILKGETLMLVERRHLEALEKHYTQEED